MLFANIFFMRIWYGVNVLEPVNCDYLFSELVNPIFIKAGEQVKVSVSVKYLDQRTKATQISQFDLTLQKDSNWKIVKYNYT